MINKVFKKDLLEVKIYSSRQSMGQEAAKEAAAWLRKAIAEKGKVNAIFAAAPSQNEFLDSLCKEEGIDWSKVHAFHMDEYVGLDADAPQGFGNFLANAIFDRLPFGSVHYLSRVSPAPTAEEICDSYTKILEENPVDVVFLGIGENGHIAFNDPGVAEFNDSKSVKLVKLDEKCRNQQVHDGCFKTLSDVPTHAVTLTIPALVKAERMFCIVPAPTKAEAVSRTINGPVSEDCPATILRRHNAATLYLDPDSSNLL